MKNRIITPDEVMELRDFGRRHIDVYHMDKWYEMTSGPMFKCYADEMAAQAKIAGHLNRGGTIKEAADMFDRAQRNGEFFYDKRSVLGIIAELCDRGKALAVYLSLELTHDKKSGYDCAKYMVGDLDEVIKKMQLLHSENLRIQTSFNGHILCSDTITVDNAYLEVTGYTKDDYDRKLEEFKRKFDEERKAEKAEMMAKLPQKGREVLAEKYWSDWDTAVGKRVGGMYNGKDMEACLEIVEALNNGCSLDKAKTIIDNQNHSGASHSLVVSEVMAFCDRGVDFAKFVNGPEWTKKYEEAQAKEAQKAQDRKELLWYKSRGVLDEKRLDVWDAFVKIYSDRPNFNIQAFEDTLEIVGVLNNGGTIDEALQVLEGQDLDSPHATWVIEHVANLCDRGEEFALSALEHEAEIDEHEHGPEIE